MTLPIEPDRIVLVEDGLKNWSAMAEKLDPEEWKEITSSAHRRVSEAVYRYEGIIAQLLGDGVFAF